MPSALEVVGRESEIGSVGVFLDEVGAGASALLLDGAAGIGKTTV
jgi:predicted ATPase